MKSQSVEVVGSRYRSVKMYHRWSDVVSLRVWDQLITESLMSLDLLIKYCICICLKIIFFQHSSFCSDYTFTSANKKKKTLRPLFMDGVQLPQGYCHFEEAVYFLPLSSQIFLVLILSTLEG